MSLDYKKMSVRLKQVSFEGLSDVVITRPSPPHGFCWSSMKEETVKLLVFDLSSVNDQVDQRPIRFTYPLRLFAKAGDDKNRARARWERLSKRNFVLQGVRLISFHNSWGATNHEGWPRPVKYELLEVMHRLIL